MGNTLNDEEFSHEMGKIRSKRWVFRIVGWILIIAGIVMMSVTYDSMTIGFIIVIVGLVIWMFSAMTLSSERKDLINRFISDYAAKTDFEYFGANMETPDWAITEAYLREYNVTDKKWEDFEVSDRYEGRWNGTHFMAANVELTGRVDSLDSDDGYKRATMFGGVLVAVETRKPAGSAFLLCFNDSMGGTRNPADPVDFSKEYRLVTDDVAYASSVVGRYENCFRKLRDVFDYTPHVFYKDDHLIVAVTTFANKFRAVNGRPDYHDVESFRQSYRDSLGLATKVLDILKEETDLI